MCRNSGQLAVGGVALASRWASSQTCGIYNQRFVDMNSFIPMLYASDPPLEADRELTDSRRVLQPQRAFTNVSRSNPLQLKLETNRSIGLRDLANNREVEQLWFPFSSNRFLVNCKLRCFHPWCSSCCFPLNFASVRKLVGWASSNKRKTCLEKEQSTGRSSPPPHALSCSPIHLF